MSWKWHYHTFLNVLFLEWSIWMVISRWDWKVVLDAFAIYLNVLLAVWFFYCFVKDWRRG